jgi:hypothetical protein
VDLTHSLATPLWVTFTDKEKGQIEEFKKIVKDHILPVHNDYYFSRFLVARKWDMKLSTELFVNAMKVRKEEGIDEILETFPKNFWFKTICDYWPTSISASKAYTAKDGCPVMYERIGLVNPKLADMIPLDILIRHHIYNVEIMEAQNRKIVEKNSFTAGTILIEDLEDLSTNHLYGKVTKLIQSISARDEVSYPESIRKVYIVNPPVVFQAVWTIMRPFIEERTQAKFSFGTSKEFAKEWELIIGKDNLPKFLGGSLDDPPSGGSIKKDIFPKMTVAELGRKDHLLVEISAKKGQTLHVEFLVSKGSDVGFSLGIKTGADNLKDRKELDEYKLKKYVEEGTPFHCKYTSPEDQTYLAFF